MSRSDFLTRLGLSAAVAVALAVALQFGQGVRWFSFYGWATLALVLVVMLAPAVWRRLGAQGFPRWPVVVLAVVIAVACLVQIGFWAAFFGLGTSGMPLGMVRSMLLGAAGPYLPWAAGLVALAAAWLLARAAGPDFRPRR
jgi:hypothetical protein